MKNKKQTVILLTIALLTTDLQLNAGPNDPSYSIKQNNQLSMHHNSGKRPVSGGKQPKSQPTAPGKSAWELEEDKAPAGSLLKLVLNGQEMLFYKTSFNTWPGASGSPWVWEDKPYATNGGSFIQYYLYKPLKESSTDK